MHICIMIRLMAIDVPSVYRDRERLRTWLTSVARDHGRGIGDLNYVLMSDDALLEYNDRYLGHDDYTDVITFGEGAGPKISGDILMSHDRIRENAKAFGVGMQQELRRVMVHGLLHLLGHDDKGKALKKTMRALEDKYLLRYR